MSSLIGFCFTESYSMNKQRSLPKASAAANSDTAVARHVSLTGGQNSLAVEFALPELTVDAWKKGWTKWAKPHNDSRRWKFAEFIVERLHTGTDAR